MSGEHYLSIILYEERGNFAFIYALARRFTEAIKERGIVSQKDFIAKDTDDMEVNISRNLKTKLSEARTCLAAMDTCRLKLHEELEIYSMRQHSYEIDFENFLKNTKREILMLIELAMQKHQREKQKLLENMKFMEDAIEQAKRDIEKIKHENNKALSKKDDIQSNMNNQRLELNKMFALKYELNVKAYEIAEKIQSLSRKLIAKQQDTLKEKIILLAFHSECSKKKKLLVPIINKLKETLEKLLMLNKALEEETKTIRNELTIITENRDRWNQNIQNISCSVFNNYYRSFCQALFPSLLGELRQKCQLLAYKISCIKKTNCERKAMYERQLTIKCETSSSIENLFKEIEDYSHEYEEAMNVNRISLIKTKLRINQERFRQSEVKKTIHKQRRVLRRYSISLSESSDTLEEKRESLASLGEELSEISHRSRLESIPAMQISSDMMYYSRMTMGHIGPMGAMVQMGSMTPMDAMRPSAPMTPEDEEKLQAELDDLVLQLKALQKIIKRLVGERREVALEYRINSDKYQSFIDKIRSTTINRIVFYKKVKRRAQTTQDLAISYQERIDALKLEIKQLKLDFMHRMNRLTSTILREKKFVEDLQEKVALLKSNLALKMARFNLLQLKHLKMGKQFRLDSALLSYVTEKDNISQQEKVNAKKVLEKKRKILLMTGNKTEATQRNLLKVITNNSKDVMNVEQNIHTELSKIRSIILENACLQREFDNLNEQCETWKYKLATQNKTHFILAQHLDCLRRLLQEMRYDTEMMTPMTEARELVTDKHLEEILNCMIGRGETLCYMCETIQIWLLKFEESFEEIGKIKLI